MTKHTRSRGKLSRVDHGRHDDGLIQMTPYPEVDLTVSLLLGSVQQILQDEFVGMYLYGSLATGDFDPVASDIDFLVATKAELAASLITQLREMHRQIGSGGTSHANRLEGSYIPLKALRRYDFSNASHPSIGVDWAFGVGHHGPAWVLERHSLSRQGVVVSGPLPEALIDPVSPQELRTAVTDLLRDFWQRQVDGADWLRPRAYQAFAMLTLCRALHTLESGTLVSK
ncbi:MAG: nucleotidyltransferase domain-containing protein, partial [Candidatus Dormibacteraeota bacterium]|nr:nucleotidyltransferase domain-containing protein [Candidatus Dormibacteraeota bacterium]